MDHMMIMRAIDHIHSHGGSVEELVSLCGGLPDPVAADNPLRYKFSWSPKGSVFPSPSTVIILNLVLGVMTAACNSARYLENGQVISVPGEGLLRAAQPSMRFPTMRLEALPNRDSLIYRDLYGIPSVSALVLGR